MNVDFGLINPETREISRQALRSYSGAVDEYVYSGWIMVPGDLLEAFDHILDGGLASLEGMTGEESSVFLENMKAEASEEVEELLAELCHLAESFSEDVWSIT